MRASLLLLLFFSASALADQLPRLPFDAPVAISLGSELSSFDLDDDSPAAREVLPLLFDTLLRRNADGTVAPNLAEGLDVRADNLQATIRLRRDVQFHDGTPLGAKDVVASIKRAKASPGGWLLAPITAIARAGDDVQLTLSRPTPELSMLFTALVTAITPGGKAPDGAHPIGSGPYVFASRQKKELRLTRNPHYFGAVPALNTLVFRSLDAASAWRSYVADSTLATRQPAGLPMLDDDNAFKRSRVTTTIFLVPGRKIAAPIAHAIGLVIDRTRLAFVLDGEPATTAVPAIYATRKPKEWPATAQPHALDEITAAPKKIALLIDESQVWMDAAAENILTDLAAGNLTLEIDAVSNAEYRRRCAAGDYELLLAAAIVAVDDPQLCALDLLAQTDEARAATIWAKGAGDASPHIVPLVHAQNSLIVKPALAGVHIDATGAVSWAAATFAHAAE